MESGEISLTVPRVVSFERRDAVAHFAIAGFKSYIIAQLCKDK